MKQDRLAKQITELRILLQNITDGFSLDSANKNAKLTMERRVLFVLNNEKRVKPITLITKLGIAKSNLALLCRSMIDAGYMTCEKEENDKRNIYYEITAKGVAELNQYIDTISNDVGTIVSNDKEAKAMEKKLDDIIEFLTRKY